jgi:serine/threonine protein kinase
VSSQQGTELKRSKYRILGLVGQGQFGRVYCAAHRQTGQLVALKSLDHQRFPTHKFLRELRFLLSLKHPNIVACQALEHTATGRYLVMDYCEAGTLRSLMTESQKLTLPQSIKLVTDILQGLDHAHSRGIVHCDIKPENILLNVQPNGWTARISDFGIARLNQEIEEQGLGNTGSPAYMAPERFYGQYPINSDLYAVGVLLYELMVGHRPFSGSPGELMSAHLNRPVSLPDSIPEVWHPVILTALQKLSARRFHSAREMLTAIATVLAKEGLEGWLHSQALPLQLEPAAAASPFQFQQQQVLKQPVKALATQISEGDCPPKIASLFEAWQSFFPKNAIQQLVLRSPGCFVLTQRSLHLLPSTAASLKLEAHLLLELQHDCVAAIAPHGRWCVTLENTRAGKLCFWKLVGKRATPIICTALTLPTRPLLPPLLFALDAHHAAVAMTPVDKRSGTFIQVLTRRGQATRLLQLPVRLGQAISTPVPYQLLAVDADYPEAILLIDLKPYRILRLGVGIEPQFLSATVWGFIVADRAGNIVAIGKDGEILGRVQGPANMTAIAPCNAQNLHITTWDGHQGKLYTADLNALGIDLLF